MRLPIALFGLGPAEFAVLAILGFGVVALPLSLAVVYLLVFRSRRDDTKGNE
jgi:hypothetical protein